MSPLLNENQTKSWLANFLRKDVTAHFFILSFLLISFLSGILGGLLVNNYYQTKEITSDQRLSRQNLSEVLTKEVEPKQLNQSLAGSIVGIYSTKTFGADLLNNNYSSLDLKGSGFILTNDGWIMTNQKVIEATKPNKYTIITQDNRAFSLDKVVLDNATNIVFAKIKSEAKIENLPTVFFTDSSELQIGNDLFSINPSGRIATGKILSMIDYYFDSRDQFVQSTEKFSKIILLAGKGYDNSFIGAPVFNLKGEIEGVVINFNNNETRILPINYLNNKFETLFKTKQIKRNYLGINYLDLSSMHLFDKKAFNLTQGALVAKNKNKIAVIKGSPAEKAGLRENDIILAVEKDLVTKLNSLTELIQQYKEGSEVSLKIKRADKTINAIIKLETR